MLSDHDQRHTSLEKARDVLRLPRTIAVLGVSRDAEKYGHEVFDVLRRRHTVYPINPKVDTIDGERCYASLDALPERPDLIVFALPPAVTEAVLPGAMERGAVLWLPPGCFTEAAAALCAERGTEVIVDICPVAASQGLAPEP